MSSEVLEKKLKEIQDIKKTSAQTNQSITEIKETQNHLSLILQEFVELKATVTKLQEKQIQYKNEVQTLRQEVHQLKQEKLSNNIVISGIPYSPGENVAHLIVKIKDHLELNAIQPEQYTDQRLSSDRGHGNSILIKFNNTKDKSDFLKNHKEIGLFANQLGFSTSDEKRIYFQKHLTSENYKLIRELRGLKRENLIKYVWFQNNNILVKVKDNSKISVIKLNTDIKKLVNGTDEKIYLIIQIKLPLKSHQHK